MTPYCDYMFIFLNRPPLLWTLWGQEACLTPLCICSTCGMVWNAIFAWAYRFVYIYTTGLRESWLLLVDSAKWQGWWWCGNVFLLSNKEPSMSGEDGTLPPPRPRLQAPFRGESSLCPYLQRAFPPSVGRTFWRQIISWSHPEQKLLASCGPAARRPSPCSPGAITP